VTAASWPPPLASTRIATVSALTEKLNDAAQKARRWQAACQRMDSALVQAELDASQRAAEHEETQRVLDDERQRGDQWRDSALAAEAQVAVLAGELGLVRGERVALDEQLRELQARLEAAEAKAAHLTAQLRLGGHL
jgi:chromosome segregation ATPase